MFKKNDIHQHSLTLVTFYLIATILCAALVMGNGINSKALSVTDRSHGINEEEPIQNEELKKTVNEYQESVKPNTIENVENDEPSSPRSHGINDDADITQVSRSAQLKKDEEAMNNFKILTVAIVIAGIIATTGALALYRSKKIKQKNDYRKK